MKAYIISVVVFFFVGYHVLPLDIYHSKLFFAAGLILPLLVVRVLAHSFRGKQAQNPASPSNTNVTAPPKTSVSCVSSHPIVPPHSRDLLYPQPLIPFADLAEGGHGDPRALFYAIRHLNPDRKRPFTVSDLDAGDFKGGAEACRFLLRHSFIREIDPGLSLALLYSKDELKGLLRDRDLPLKGSKEELAGRLLQSGFRPDGKKHARKLYELTSMGRELINCHSSDMITAVHNATLAVKRADFSKAISAYREYDATWGFAHSSGKNHTIFAHFDIPFSRFDFIAGYPMPELHNSADFKNSLRACLIAGLMRGEQGRAELAYCFRDICQEQILCPNITRYFSTEDFDDYTGAVIKHAMERKIEYDNDNILEYYISRVLYLSRRA